MDEEATPSGTTLDDHEAATVEGLSAGVPPTRDDGPIEGSVDVRNMDAIDGPDLDDVTIQDAQLEIGVASAPSERETAQVFFRR